MNVCSRCRTMVPKDLKYCVVCGQRMANTYTKGRYSKKKAIPYSPVNRMLTIIAAFLVIANIILLGINLSRSAGNSSRSDGSIIQDNTSVNNETTSTIETANREDTAQSNIITGEYSYTGTIKVDGLSCCLVLENAISYQDPIDTQPVTSNSLWLSESDVAAFKGYNGLTVTLVGELFNYRGGGTLMFNGTPTIVSVSGTPDIVAESSLYQNWEITDNETKFWDAIEVLKTIVYKCDGVWDVRVLCDESVLTNITTAGFSNYESVMLSINDEWVSSYGYEFYIMPDKEYVYIGICSNDIPDMTTYTYRWSGEFVNGDMPLEEYILRAGLT